MAGAALGGVLVAIFGASVALLIDAAFFALIALLMATAPGLPEAQAETSSCRARVREGLAHAWRLSALGWISARRMVAGEGATAA